MKITPHEKDLIKAKLDKYWLGEKKCPICLSDAWVVIEKVFFLPEFNYPRGGLKEGADNSEYPAIIVACGVCGYFLTFNPVLLGVFDQLSGTHLDETPTSSGDR